MRIGAYIKNYAPIKDVIGRHAQLHKAGSKYTALCVFHDEKSPSMSIDPARGYFKCFGCGASGDAIGFIQKLHNTDFLSACKILIQEFNIPEPERVYRNSVRTQIKDLEKEGRLEEAKALMLTLENK